MSKKAKPEKNQALFYKDPRNEAERILDSIQQYREERELVEMNGSKCGCRQVNWLRQYNWRQRTKNA